MKKELEPVRCEDCRWWRLTDLPGHRGECHLNPPNMVVTAPHEGADNYRVYYEHPITYGKGFCSAAASRITVWDHTLTDGWIDPAERPVPYGQVIFVADGMNKVIYGYRVRNPHDVVLSHDDADEMPVANVRAWKEIARFNYQQFQERIAREKQNETQG